MGWDVAVKSNSPGICTELCQVRASVDLTLAMAVLGVWAVPLPWTMGSFVWVLSFHWGFGDVKLGGSLSDFTTLF